MIKNYHQKSSGVLLAILIGFTGMFMNLHAQSFSQNSIDFNGKGSLSGATSLTFGPDGRLYVTEYSGNIKIFSLEREGPGHYVVQDIEVLTGIKAIQNHNDDGSPDSNSERETIGMVVLGTAENPVIYASSSDFRIGGGGGGGKGDIGLDTNSGIITRFTWNGNSWDVVDIVRGLPRSEENHASNGLEYAHINGQDYLLLAQGGHTNAGSPSVNFAYTTEYALSAAVLSINLSVIEAMPIQEDNGRKYIYDLPTLDDPTRPNKNGITDPDDPGYDGIDVNDPFGGNDGLNQAIIVPGGPVQIFSPGYRNAYDLVVTESGAVYVTDNGANGGWGGFPENEGMGGNATNNYVPGEPGSSSPAEDGEQINNKDHLTLVTMDIQNYEFGSFYGGHPNPVRANPHGAGLYVNPSPTGNAGAVFRTQKYDPDGSTPNSIADPNLALPANWPPVQVANPQEGDWRGPDMHNPDGPDDVLVTTWATNTNGIDEYTASNFDGAMKGNLLAGDNRGDLRRVELNPDGSLKKLTSSFVSGLGGNALGITCNGDTDPFPGTIWVATLSGTLEVLEPQDFIICIEPGDPDYDPNADYDFDGYTNQDEVDNGTDPCNGGSQPQDFDKAAGGELISDLNDDDDDNDGIPDALDPFQLGDPLKDGSDAFEIPVINELFSDNTELKGYLGLGLTGLMNNGDPNPNWLNWLDRRDDPNDPNPNDILGGAIGAMTMQMTSGTAHGAINTQEKGFQYGVQVDQTSGSFTVSGGIVNFDAPLQLYGNTSAPDGELGIFMGDGSQSNYLKFVATKTGITAQQEINDVPQPPLEIAIPFDERPQSGIVFYFVVDPSSGEVHLEFAFDNSDRQPLGSISLEGAILEAVQNSTKDLAVGLIGTSNAPGVEVEGTWDFLNVVGNIPFIVAEIENIEERIGSNGQQIDLNQHFDDDRGVTNLTFSVHENTNPTIGAEISENFLNLIYPQFPAQTDITIRATDQDANYIDYSFKVSVVEQLEILYRVNAGGPAIAAIDGEMAWGADTSGENSPYLSVAGRNKTYKGGMVAYTEAVDQTTVPVGIFDTERSDDKAGAPNITYSFPVSAPGSYEVRLYLGNWYHGTSEPGQRKFSVLLEGTAHAELSDIDLSGTFGHQIGGVISKTIEVTDGVLDVSFIHGVENPLINGIEILGGLGPVSSIQLSEIPDQTNYAGDVLDGSLAVSASGGEGNLSYSISGAPAGVVIEPTNGMIGGSIDSLAAFQSPYTVTVTVDDQDPDSDNSVSTSFTWTVHSADPFITDTIPDFVRTLGSGDEELVLDTYFGDNGGSENLVYSLEENTNPAFVAVITDNTLTISYPNVPGETGITIRATDGEGGFVEQTFNVTLSEVPDYQVLYRVNAGGPAIAAIDGEMAWGADTSGENSPYLSVAGRNKTYKGGMVAYTEAVDQTTVPVSIFDTERSDDKAGAPNITYSFPVSAPGSYEVRLYLGNWYHGTSEPGQRKFSVLLEGTAHAELSDIDLSGTFGHQVGGVISKTIEVTDGVLDISFIHGVENPLINGIEILGGLGPVSSIQLSEIPDQTNYAGDVLDGSLAVSASGGEGNLSYSISGAPAGVVIEPTNGMIGGSIDSLAAFQSPYTVTVTVDDQDPDSDNSVSTSFTWTVHSADPFITDTIPDFVRTLGSGDEELVLDTYFGDNGGSENLVYSLEENTNPAFVAVITDNTLTISYPNVPGETGITIRATDGEGGFVEQTFNVTLSEVPDYQVLYRVNAGGPAIAAIDGEMAWGADTSGENSPYLSVAGRNKTYKGGMVAYTEAVDQTTVPVGIFDTERSDDKAGAPNITYSFPVSAPGFYEVRLYLGNWYHGTSEPGQRKFSVLLEGIAHAELSDIDLSGTFGHQVGGVISKTIEVTDGVLDVSFIHGVENPLINGIEILRSSGAGTDELEVASIPGQTSVSGKALPTGLKVSASGGQGILTFSMEGAPEGVSINSQTGEISGTIHPSAAINSPYQVTVTVQSSSTAETASTSFIWIVNNAVDQPWFVKGENTSYTPRHENSFVQAGDKFYLMGGRENARTIDVYDYNTDTWTALVDSAPHEFNHFQATEYQGLIWIIGAFKTNTYPEELPADFIWIFDPVTTQWIQGPEIPQDRRRGAAGLVVYQDKFYIIGGNTKGHNGGYVSWFDEYDPKTGVWTALDDAPRARDHFHAEVIDGRLYAVGGRLSGGLGGGFKPVIPEVDVFDFQTGHWSVLPADLPTPRAGAAVAEFNEQLVVVGGEVEQELVYGTYRDDALEITEAYDPQTGQWSRWGDLNYKRHGTQAIVSGEGLYVLAGSPNKGGGNQKQMEYIGVDSPVGTALTTGVLQAPEFVELTEGMEGSVMIYHNGGNTGIFINSISITGPDAEHFELGSGAIANIFLTPGDSLELDVIYNGSLAGATASIDLRYAEDQIFSIQLEGTTENIPESGPAMANAFHAQLVPNPVLNNAVLSLEAQQEVNGIQIYSFNGSLLRSFEPKKITMGRGRYNLELSNLPMGMYFVRVYAGELVQTLQFIKR